jgi:hypothetical protein
VVAVSWAIAAGMLTIAPSAKAAAARVAMMGLVFNMVCVCVVLFLLFGFSTHAECLPHRSNPRAKRE